MRVNPTNVNALQASHAWVLRWQPIHHQRMLHRLATVSWHPLGMVGKREEPPYTCTSHQEGGRDLGSQVLSCIYFMRVGWKVHRLTIKKELCHNNETWHALNSIFPDTKCKCFLPLKPTVDNSELWIVVSTTDISWTAWKTDEGCPVSGQYSCIPDLAPSDYFLFPNMNKSLSWWNRTPYVSFPGHSWKTSSTTFQSPELRIQCGLFGRK